MSENQELIRANAHITSLEQKIMSRDKGKRGKYIAEFMKVKRSEV